MSRLELDKGDTVYVRIPIPGSTDPEPYKIKKGVVVSTAARAAKIQVEGEPPDKPRHITWSKISKTPDGFKSNGRRDQSINRPRLTTKTPRKKPNKDPEPVADSEPELSVEVKAIDQDLSDWLSMGGDLADALKTELAAKQAEREDLRADIAALNVKLEASETAIRAINKKIEKLSAVQKMLEE